MKFIPMKHGLKHSVYCGSTVVIPKGTKGVKIAFRQSHLWRKDEETGKLVRMNVYMHKGHCYHM